MTQLRGLGDEFRILGDAVTVQLTGRVGAAVQGFDHFIRDHIKQITEVISTVGRVMLFASEAIGSLVVSISAAIGEVVGVFSGLDSPTKHLIEGFAAIGAAWVLLNTSFLASPLGIVAGLAAAVVLLWQDYEVWKAGGSSLIDWAKWEPDIAKAKEAIIWLGEHINAMAQYVGGWQNVMEGFAVFVAGSWALRVVAGLTQVGAAFAATSAGMAGTALGRLMGMATGAGVAGLAVGVDMLEHHLAPGATERMENAEDRYLPGSAWVSDFFATHFGFMGRTYAEQAASQGRQDAAHTSLPDNPYHETRQQMDVAEESFAFWKSHGATDAFAASMVAAESRESGFNSGARGDKVNGVATAAGSFQWHADRRARILAATGIDVTTADHRGQLEAAYQEMRQNLDAGAGRVFGILNSAASTLIGTNATVNDFERPGDRVGAQATDQHYADGFLRLHSFRTSPLFQPALPSRPSPAAGGAPSAALHQTTNITVQGVSDPQAAATEVARQQDSTSQRAVRHLSTAVQ